MINFARIAPLKKSSFQASLKLRRCQSFIALEKFDNEFVSVRLDNKLLNFSTLFLRDLCTSSKSVDPFSKQKLFTTGELVSRKLSLNRPPVISNEHLEIEWNEDGKVFKSQYSSNFLETIYQKSVNKIDQFQEAGKLYWDNKSLVSNIDKLQVDAEDFLKLDPDFQKTVNNLNEYGLAFINNISKPSLDKMNESNSTEWPVFKLAERFGYVKRTFYGTLFDVKNEKEDAKNIANTSTFLPLHMDLLYYESPPGLQLLHFIDNSTIGGDNVFSDSFAAARHVKKVDPSAYKALLKVPITYHYDNNNEHYFYKRPLVVEFEDIKISGESRIKEVNYSPPFQGPFEFGVIKDESEDNTLFNDFLRGYSLFESFVNDPLNSFQLKMKEGSCAIFDNRRVLHSRLEFSDSNGGDRWLMGCYVDGDSFRSKLRVSNRK